MRAALGALADHERQGEEAARHIGFEHRAIIRDHRQLAVLLPQRKRLALDDVDLKLVREELLHRCVGNPGIGLEAISHGDRIEEQERRATRNAADRQHFVLCQLLAAVDGNGSDAEADGIGDRVAGIAERGAHLVDMAALDDAEPDAAAQQGNGGRGAEAMRQILLDQRDQARGGLRPLGCRCRHDLARWDFTRLLTRLDLACPVPISPSLRKTCGDILAQQDRRAKRGGPQVSLGPL